MKKRAFTLIELIAVIIILAIIALIATPKIVRVVKEAKKEAIEKSAERYFNAVETAISTNDLENKPIKDGIYTVNKDGNLVLEETILVVETSGNKPIEGSKVSIQNREVISKGTNMEIGDYIVIIDNEENVIAMKKKKTILCMAAKPTEQKGYFQVEVPWGGYTYDYVFKVVGVQATPDDPYALGAVYSCELGDRILRTFYVLKDEGSNVKLIMNENVVDGIRWGSDCCSQDTVPDIAEAELANKTKDWKKLSPQQITLPSSSDVAPVLGQDWLKVNIYPNCSSNIDRCGLGYWTSTLSSGWGDYHPIYMQEDGHTNSYNSGENYGIRPVITVSKANLSL